MLDNCHEFPLINTNYWVEFQSNAITLYMFFYRSFLKKVFRLYVNKDGGISCLMIKKKNI